MAATVTIICPKCQAEIPIEEAFSHQIADRLEKEHDMEMADLQKQLEEKQKKVQEMQEFELELRKQKREVEEKAKEMNLELQRRLDEERKNIEESLTKKFLEDHRLKEAEKDKIISDLKTALDDAQKKAAQGSQQTQGEVLELEIEQTLKKEFPQDNISEVKKGVRGADILQEVVDRNGRMCGKILWESKNAEWSGQWPAKLREDQRNAKAEIAALVSVNLPADINNFVFRENIWISSVTSAVSLAYALRFNLIQAHQLRMSAASKGEKKDELYDYITGMEFKHRVEAMMEAYQNLLKDIETEKRWFSSKWAKQEKSLQILLDQTGSFHGELAGIVGPALPKVENLELTE